ncbi:MAG: leucine-rich repeat domain-containing protein, partial [Anaeroplasmataceae bacterium]|nr:leucine-rich repeat domain-containing protein [Anaeroplasmataceae bacterium]
MDNRISARMFYNCDSLEDIVIPNHVDQIGDYAFAECDDLKYVHQENDLVGQYMYYNDKALLHVFHSASADYLGFDEFGQLVIGVNADGSFRYGVDNHEAETIGFRASTETIGQHAFENCKSLEEVVLPTGDQFDTIANAAFKGCSSITEINIPENIVQINDQAFENCIKVEEVNFSENGKLDDIGSKAFSNLREVESLIVPTTVTHIGEGAFSRLIKLHDLSIPFVGDQGNPEIESTQYNSLFGYIFGYATEEDGKNPDNDNIMYRVQQMYGEASSYWVFMPNSLKEVTVYGDIQDQLRYGAFSGCQYIEHIYLCESIKKIEEYVFAGCYRLEDMDMSTLTELEYIKDKAFERCLTISEIIFPETDTFKYIGADCFAYCATLEELTIPNSIEEIGKHIFTGCQNLATVTLPFVGRTREVENNRTDDSTFAYFFDSIRPNYYDLNVAMNPIIDPNQPVHSTTDTYDYTHFTETLQYYKDFVLPNPGYEFFTDGSTSNEDENGEYIIGFIPKSLKTVTITSETVIAYGAFMDCEDIEKVTLVNELDGVTLTLIDDYGFFNMDSLVNVNKIESNEVTSDIEILDTITSVGHYAFADCDSIQNIFTPKASIDFGTYVFAFEHGLTNLQFRTEAPYRGFILRSHMFYFCDALEILVTPEDIDVIGDVEDYVFAWALSLVSLDYNDDKLGDHMFDTCVSLPEVSIHECVTTVGSYVFAYNDSLENVLFENGIIGRYMFYNDMSLVEVNVPTNVYEIRFAAFENCYNLTTLELPFVGQYETADQSVFDGYYYNGETKELELIADPSLYEDYVELGISNSVFGWIFGILREGEELNQKRYSLINQIFRLPESSEDSETTPKNTDTFKIQNSLINVSIIADGEISFGAFSSTKVINYTFETETTENGHKPTTEFGKYAFAYSDITTLNLADNP